MPKFSADGRIDRFKEIPEGLQDLDSEAGAGMVPELLNSLQQGFDMADCKPAGSPISPNVQLISISTRPDIAFALYHAAN